MGQTIKMKISGCQFHSDVSGMASNLINIGSLPSVAHAVTISSSISFLSPDIAKRFKELQTCRCNKPTAWHSGFSHTHLWITIVTEFAKTIPLGTSISI